MTGKVNYKAHSDALAEILQEFVWIHAGSDNGVALKQTFQDALHVLLAYRRDAEPKAQKLLKQILQDAYWESGDLQRDPWEAVLEALADRAQDWEKHVTDDGSTTDDIREWLRAEAAR